MKCPNCGREIANDSQFCEYCGVKINLISDSLKQSKSQKALWITLLVVLCVLVLGGVIYYEHEVVEKAREEARLAREQTEHETELRIVAEENLKREIDGKRNNGKEPKEDKVVRKEQLIYQMTGERVCDGKYYGPDWEFDYYNCGTLLYTDLKNLNFSHFRFSFDFLMYENEERWSSHTIIALDSSYRIFLIEEENGKIIISTDNWDHKYETGINVPFGQWKKINVEYDRGKVVLNGKHFNVIVKNADKGDRIFSTVCFGGGEPLHGKIRNVEVYNIYDK